MGPLVVLVLVGLMAHAVLGGSDCQGKVGAYSYDLSPLARQLGDNDVVLDDWGNTYYYRVCGVVSNTFCQTVDDMTPAVCQKDQRQPPQYHDCGNQRTATFGQLQGGSDSEGFTLAFSSQDRAARVHFKCDPHQENAVFSFVKEDPINTYTLQCVSKYACPVTQQPSSAPHHLETVTLCDCQATGCGRCMNFLLDQCTPDRSACSGKEGGAYIFIQRSGSQGFVIRAYLDSTCSFEVARSVIGCGECNGRVRAQCGSGGGLPGWAIALIVVSVVGALVAALGGAIVAYLVYRRCHRTAVSNYTLMRVQ